MWAHVYRKNMAVSPTIVALSGSLRDGSHTRTALEHVLDAADSAGGDTELVDLRDFELPRFDPNLDEQGDSEALARIVRGADSVILGTPVYHGSYSSTMKNALDYCGRDEFADTTVGLLAVAGGGSYASTLDHLRVIARTLHAWVLPHQVGIRGASSAFENGEFVDDALAERTAKLGRRAVEYASIEPNPANANSGRSASADD